MAKNSERFIASFNRINKWLAEVAENPQNTGFVALINYLKKRRDLRIAPYANDLLQFAQLRNAIVHDKTGQDFVIAEPNDWAVERIEYIENELIRPEKVLPRFRKKISAVPRDASVEELLRLVAYKKYTIYPVVDGENFVGVLTLNRLAILLSEAIIHGQVSFSSQPIQSVLERTEKKSTFAFIHSKLPINEAVQYFQKNPTLEVLLITKNGNENEKLLGIIRPKDLFRKRKGK